jgi:hypothetical protein
MGIQMFHYCICILEQEQFFKIPKGYLDTVNWRMTDSTMAKNKYTRGQTMIYKTLQRKQKIGKHEPN